MKLIISQLKRFYNVFGYNHGRIIVESKQAIRLNFMPYSSLIPNSPYLAYNINPTPEFEPI